MRPLNFGLCMKEFGPHTHIQNHVRTQLTKLCADKLDLKWSYWNLKKRWKDDASKSRFRSLLLFKLPCFLCRNRIANGKIVRIEVSGANLRAWPFPVCKHTNLHSKVWKTKMKVKELLDDRCLFHLEIKAKVVIIALLENYNEQVTIDGWKRKSKIWERKSKIGS